MVNVTATALTIIYFVILLGIGYAFMSRAGSSTSDFWKAAGSISVPVNSFAIFAAMNSGSAFVGSIGFAYQLGVTMLWVAMLTGVGGLILSALIFAKPMKNVDRNTLTDIFDTIYEDDRITVLVAVVVAIGFLIFLVSNLRAAGLAAEFVLDINYAPAVIIIGAVFLAYTAIGGMWAVTFTDVLQGVVMFAMMLIVFAASLTVFDLNPLGPVTETPRMVAAAPLPALSVIGFGLIFLAIPVVYPHVTMRLFTSENPDDAYRAFAWAALLVPLFQMMAFFVPPAAARVLNPELAEPDQALIVIMDQLLPTFVAAFVAVAILAAVMSTTDSILLVLSAAVSNDIYENVINPEASQGRVIRLGQVASFAFGIGAIIWAAFFPPELLVQLLTDGFGVMAAGLFWPLIFGVWWKRMNRYGAILGILGGVVAYIAGFVTLPAFQGILVAMPVSFILCIVGSLITSPRPAEEIRELGEKLGHRA